jgi:hypothetical protein
VFVIPLLGILAYGILGCEGEVSSIAYISNYILVFPSNDGRMEWPKYVVESKSMSYIVQVLCLVINRYSSSSTMGCIT